MDTHDYNAPDAVQQAFIEHYKDYRRDMERGDGYGQCRHLGAFRMHENRLRDEYKYTRSMIQGLIARAQLELEEENKKADGSRQPMPVRHLD